MRNAISPGPSRPTAARMPPGSEGKTPTLERKNLRPVSLEGNWLLKNPKRDPSEKTTMGKRDPQDPGQDPRTQEKRQGARSGRRREEEEERGERKGREGREGGGPRHCSSRLVQCYPQRHARSCDATGAPRNRWVELNGVPREHPPYVATHACAHGNQSRLGALARIVRQNTY